MKILIACEYSGTVRDAFRKMGHDAWSCDILPTEGDSSFHYQYDIKEVLNKDWDMIIAFPPCTHLAVSGSKYFKQKIADGRQQEGIDFFMLFANHPCAKIAIENPVGIMSSKWRKPDQIINPFQFGHPEAKKTCLWLKGLPKLTPTDILQLPESGKWENQHFTNGKYTGFINKDKGKVLAWNNPLTQKLRGKTYQGIANAIAQQWGTQSLPYNERENVWP